jgi:hypothetical protein
LYTLEFQALESNATCLVSNPLRMHNLALAVVEVRGSVKWR